MRPKHIATIDSYVKGMIAIANDRLKEDWQQQVGAPALNYWLEDYRTVGYKIPRQLGATAYIHEEAIADPHGLLITRDHKQRDNIRDHFTRDGKLIGFMEKLDDETQRGLPSVTMNRIITVSELLGFMRVDLSIPENVEQWKIFWKKYLNVKTVYIDEGTRMFSRVRLSKFYKYLSEVVLDSDGLIIIAQ